jgi:hypothetical protein
LFCFFEGERGSDNSYYIPRIKQFTDNYYTINCKGKEKVLKVHELIKAHREYDKYKKAFFIDRDFDKPLPAHKPPIFETPCYSIENFYVSIGVFKEILKNTLQISEVDNAYEICLKLFTERQKEFHLAVTLFNAWYACLIDLRSSTGNKIGAILDEKFPRNFLAFTLKSITTNYDLKKIKQKYPDALEVTETMLDSKVREFSKCNQQKVFRGKYEMQFVVKLIELILQDSSTTKEFLKRKIKFAFGGVSHAQAISVFSPYAETPNSLMKYLTHITKG